MDSNHSCTFILRIECLEYFLCKNVTLCVVSSLLELISCAWLRWFMECKHFAFDVSLLAFNPSVDRHLVQIALHSHLIYIISCLFISFFFKNKNIHSHCCMGGCQSEGFAFIVSVVAMLLVILLLFNLYCADNVCVYEREEREIYCHTKQLMSILCLFDFCN